MAGKEVMVKCGPMLRRDTGGLSQFLVGKKKGLSKGPTLYSHPHAFSFMTLCARVQVYTINYPIILQASRRKI